MTRAAFYDTIRPLFGGKMDQKQVDGTEALLAATDDLPITHRAYILATAFHETAHTMQPIAEYGKGRGKKYGVKDESGKAPYGRGYVQLTWRDNYAKADDKLALGGALVKDYDLAMQPTIAAQIIVRGMQEGWFTGKKMHDYLPGDYVNARRIVNGMDRAKLIAGYAVKFEAALSQLPIRIIAESSARAPEKPATAPQAPAAAIGPQIGFWASVLQLLKAIRWKW